MALGDEVRPWERDDVLVSAMAVEWIAKNVFLVAVPAYRRKVSCELTAVDVPRGTSPLITERVAALLRRVNAAMRIYLRQDLYSNFPEEAYGDVIFSAESKDAATATELHWCSLQEELVLAGAACVVRPSALRQEALLAAEAAVETHRSTSPSSSWLAALQQRERSSLFCLERRCVVEDVMRGDVYRVSWLPSGDFGGREGAPRTLPPLLILDSTVCHSVSTQPGFAALRWSQLHLLRRELIVHVHAVYPCDRDVAFNTQLETYEHLANARGSAAVVMGTSGEEEKSEDVGVALVTLGLGWVRRVTDAGVPRASNLFDVFRAIEHLATAEGSGEAAALWPESEPAACAALGRLWALPPHAAAGLLRFHDMWWRQACWVACSSNGGGGGSTAQQPQVGTTARVWKRSMWCADFHVDPNDEPRVYVHRPLRTLFPLAGLAEWRVRLRGQVNGAVVVRTAEDKRAFLQIEVTATMPAAVWRQLRRSCGYADLDVVRFSPAPGDAVLGKRVKVNITASSFGPEVETRLRVCCTSYTASAFLPSQHTPSGVWHVTEGAWCEEELSVEGTAKEERVFVLDVTVEARDAESMLWTQRGVSKAVYLLSPDLDVDPGDAADGDDEGKEANTTARAAAEKRNESAAVQQSLSYRCSVSVFYELDAAAAADSAGLVSELQRSAAELMYEDVEVLPVGVAEVCGVRGLVGDLFFPSTPPPRTGATPLQERAPVSFTRSLLSSIGAAWWPPAAAALSNPSSAADAASVATSAPWPMTTAMCDAVQESFVVCLAKVAEEECTARQAFLKEVEWHYQVLDQEALNTFPSYQPQPPFPMDDVALPVAAAPSPCLSLRAGDVALWRDAAEPSPTLSLPSSLLPSTVPLSVFAVRPRELFSVASTQKMKTMGTRKTTSGPVSLQEKSYDQQDWAFLRLRFPFLPNVLQCDWERLPLSLRNTERALCESIARDGRIVREPGMLFSTDRIYSTLLSYLALLQAMQASRTSATATASKADPSPLAAVYETLQQGTPSFWDDCKTAMHFSATLFVLPAYQTAEGARPPSHSRPLFLGSRANVVSDAFEIPRSDNAAPEVVAFPLLRDLTTQCVSAAALETFAERVDSTGTPAPAVENLDAGRRPDELRTIDGQGLPWAVAQSGTPLLFHPLPRVAVLASPLVERTEYAPDTLGQLQLDHDTFATVKDAPPAEVAVRRRVVLQYRCANKFSEKSPYKTISYGRVSSVDMFKTLLSDRARGREVQAYMSLLLRRSAGGAKAARGREEREEKERSGESAGEWPDGLLTLHGLPSEALFVHYRSRADLRFTLSTASPPLRHALLQAERSNVGAETVEADLLALLSDAAAAAVRKVYERVRVEQRGSDAAQQIALVFTLQPWDGDTRPYVAVQVFPVHPSDAETTQRVLDQEKVWPQGGRHPGNPHRAFSLVGSRFGRLALAELRIHYSDAEEKFVLSWNEMFETGESAAAAPAA